MKIGITYDLKADYLKMGFSEEEAAEFDKVETIDAIDSALSGLGFETDRIGHAKNLVDRIVSGHSWNMVFNICEGVCGIGREAQVPAILDIYNIPYVFSDPLVLSLTLHKGMTKHVIRDLGIPTADFYVITKEDDIGKVVLPYPLFVKPVAEGTGKGVDDKSKINDFNSLKIACLEKLQRYNQPMLVETFLPGREFTVGIVGTGDNARCIGLMECHFRESAGTNVYSYDNKSNYEEFMDYTVPEGPEADAVCKLALDAWRGLNCRDGGRIDVRMDAKGIPNFIEVNPLAGLHPIDSDIVIIAKKKGITYTRLIGFIMESAMERYSI